MSLFDNLVAQALQKQGELASLLPVVEKELLHHDILREMSSAGLLGNLTFIGGTCLRACYGSHRLSEDLDFTGGDDFKQETLSRLGTVLVEQLAAKYGLPVEMREPVLDTGNVRTWKLKMITRPEHKGMPSQRINIDVCALPSYDKRPVVLRNLYGVDMGTSGLIMQAQSREEILADKLIAFALRPNRLKNRDLWDIGWLKQNNVSLPLELIPKKIQDHYCTVDNYLPKLLERAGSLRHDPGVKAAFVHEMQRFLPPRTVRDTVNHAGFWDYLCDVIQTECDLVADSLKKPVASNVASM